LAGWKDVAEHEAVAFDDLAGLAHNRLGEHRSGMNEGVKLAVLSARIDIHRQVIE
jgi:hypothetical protein